MIWSWLGWEGLTLRFLVSVVFVGSVCLYYRFFIYPTSFLLALLCFGFGLVWWVRWVRVLQSVVVDVFSCVFSVSRFAACHSGLGTGQCICTSNVLKCE